jgi:hypothetical protein
MQRNVHTAGPWRARAAAFGIALLCAAGWAIAAADPAASPDYRIELTVDTDTDAPAYDVTLGVRAGEPATARQDHASGSTTVTLTATPDSSRTGDVVLDLRIERDGTVLGTPKATVRFDQPARIAMSRHDGSTLYALDLRVSRWDPAADGR